VNSVLRRTPTRETGWMRAPSAPLMFSCRLEDAILHVDIVHANIGDGFNPLGGSTCLPLCEVLDERLGSVVARDLCLTSSPPTVHVRITD
jgi:hypothetical protein